MKYIMKQTLEPVWEIRPDSDKISEKLSENSIKIIESGFPDNWLEIYEDAYGKVTIKRLNARAMRKKYDVIMEREQFLLDE